MNKLTVDLEVGNQRGNRFRSIQVTVDLRSTFSALPRALLEDLSVPVDRQANSRLADGHTVPIDLGWTMVRLEGQTIPTSVSFAEDGEPTLPGMVTPGEALLAVDREAQRLIPADVDRLWRSGIIPASARPPDS